MPRKQLILDSDEDDYDETHHHSQRKSQLSHKNMDKCVGLVCNCLLVAESKKIPAKGADIKRMLREQKRHFTDVMAKAADVMEEVYAYKVVELEKKNNYILVNTIDPSHYDNESKDATKMGLLTAILAAIFMTGEVMQEGPMREYLKKLSIDIDLKEHPVFGDVSKFIHQELVKQKYIDITRNMKVDPPTREYRWGERAHQEVSKKEMLDLVCKVYGNNMKPEIWTSQWKIVNRENSKSDENSA